LGIGRSAWRKKIVDRRGRSKSEKKKSSYSSVLYHSLDLVKIRMLNFEM